jgi:Flp pilus assembly protein TadD
LKIVPEEPSVLSNLGLSYVLSKDLPRAEETLRRAYGNARADARVRQNLGLVVGLQGRFAEAETIVKADLPAEEAAANVAYLKQMLNRKDGPRAGAGKVPVASLNQPD